MVLDTSVPVAAMAPRSPRRGLLEQKCMCLWEVYTRRMPEETRTVEELLETALDRMVEGDAACAAASFEQVLAIDPRHAEARHGLVRALEDAGRVEEALQVTEQLMAGDPDDVLAVTPLSMLYQHQGRIAEAEAAAARAKILGWKQELRSGVAAKTTL